MEKQLLSDIECEKQVIGALLIEDKYRECAEYLTPECFTVPTYREIYKAIGAVTDNGERAEPISVFAYLQKKPKEKIEIALADLLEIQMAVASTVTLDLHCRRLADLSQRRKMYVIGCRLEQAGRCEVGETDTIREECVKDLQSLDEAPQTTIKPISSAIRDLDLIVQGNLTGDHTRGIPTGFAYLDAKGGLQPTDLCIIAAEFSQGKTSLALDLCFNAATQGYAVAFYSTEMMSTQLTARLLAAKTGISSRIMQQSPLSPEQMKKYDEAIREVEALPIFFDDTSTLSVEKISSSIRSLVRKQGVKVAFIDYLQVLQTNEKSLNRTEEQFFGVVARKFKNLAKELQITIVLLSQMARAKDTTEPTLSRIRGSGQITEAAYVVLLIYRPEVYGKNYSDHRINVSPEGTAQIKIAKGRNIGTGDFICGFEAATTHFFDLYTIPTLEIAKIDENRPF
jgi:replicative DNA helicase